MKKITYEEHVKELLKDKKVREEYEKLLPEYDLARSIIEQRLKKKDDPGRGSQEGRNAAVYDFSD